KSLAARTAGSESKNARIETPASSGFANWSRATMRERVASLRVCARDGSIGRSFIAMKRASQTTPGAKRTLDSLQGEIPGRSTARSVLGFEVEVMDRFDEADRARLRAHHYAVGHRAAGEKAHAAQVIAGGYPGRREHHVLTRDFFESEFALEIQD